METTDETPGTPPVHCGGGLKTWMQSHKLVAAFFVVLALIAFNVVAILVNDYFTRRNIATINSLEELEAKKAAHLSRSPATGTPGAECELNSFYGIAGTDGKCQIGGSR